MQARKAKPPPSSATQVETEVDTRLAQLGTKPPPESTKRRAFRRIGEPRLANALEAMDLLGLMADSSRYDFNDSDIAYIQAQLVERVAITIDKFLRGNPRPNIGFPTC